MLHFQDQPWMLRHGVSHIAARISSDAADPRDIFWHLDLSYVNRAACWRRVPWRERPEVELSLHGFLPPERSWRSLEHADYWDLTDQQWDITRHGWVDLTLCLDGRRESPGGGIGLGCDWRVLKREGAIFTVELSLLPKGYQPPPATEEEILITADGTEESADPDDDFRHHPDMIYIIEDVPFGVVTVEVPRNVRDPIAFAIARARTFINAPDQPEQIDIHDFAEPDKAFGRISGDLFVTLHYHGFHSD